MEIYDDNSNRIWKKPIAGYYIKIGNYYLNKTSGAVLTVTTSTTPSTVWKIESNNTISCFDNNTTYYLQCGTSGNRVVQVNRPTATGYAWLYKNGNYITATISGTTYYLYRYDSGTSGVRMRTNATTLTFEPVY